MIGIQVEIFPLTLKGSNVYRIIKTEIPTLKGSHVITDHFQPEETQA
jgi:hypothetical protein